METGTGLHALAQRRLGGLGVVLRVNIAVFGIMYSIARQQAGLRGASPLECYKRRHATSKQ